MSRAGRVVVLVDGSNVARSTAWAEVMRREDGERPHEVSLPDPDPRVRLLDWILFWTTSSGADIVVVFDGQGPLGAGRTQWNHSYLVIGSGSADGDSVVESEAQRLHREGAAFRLVTSDRALASVAGAHAEVVLDVDHFIAELATDPHVEPGRTLGAQLAGSHGEEADSTTRLRDTIDDDDVRARLERMRRGLDPDG